MGVNEVSKLLTAALLLCTQYPPRLVSWRFGVIVFLLDSNGGAAIGVTDLTPRRTFDKMPPPGECRECK